jgi:flagellar motor switch protein FliM
MTFPVDPTVLRRKIAAHARAPVARPDAGAQAMRALGRALRHAATPFEGLGVMPGTITVEAGQDLDAAIAALPDHGLVAALEEEGSRGLLGLAPGLVDALVEVQTTGRVEAAELPPRQVTRIDEALARDFIDLVLAAFARETATIEARDWPDRLGYGSRIRDRGQISLLLPEGSYTILSADLGFDGVERRTSLVLVLPSNPALARRAAPDRPRPVDPAWVAARTRLIETLQLPLEVVLMRVTQPLGEVQRLAVGDLLPFGVGDLQEVSLETLEGRVLAHGRLGQLGGRRALRLPPRPVSKPAAGAPDGLPTDPAPPQPALQPALPTRTETEAR